MRRNDIMYIIGATRKGSSEQVQRSTSPSRASLVSSKWSWFVRPCSRTGSACSTGGVARRLPGASGGEQRHGRGGHDRRGAAVHAPGRAPGSTGVHDDDRVTGGYRRGDEEARAEQAG